VDQQDVHLAHGVAPDQGSFDRGPFIMITHASTHRTPRPHSVETPASTSHLTGPAALAGDQHWLAAARPPSTSYPVVDTRLDR
jgi:hypothetical protein